ncbi:MAG: glutathione peroxidase, partial [Schleiferiaceae bacterium]|nr:glutathione peroxidase [Schleiferiaceae bacterium]
QFGNQEAGDDQSIADFCEKNYGVTFQMMAKVKVKGDKQHPVYTWLTSKSENGAKSSQVLWNFHKFLVDDQGRWLGNYGSKTSPLDVDLTSFAYEDGH